MGYYGAANIDLSKQLINMKQLSIILFVSITSLILFDFGFLSQNNLKKGFSAIGIELNNVGFINNNGPDFDFIYKIDTRFASTVTKYQLDQAISITDLVKREDRESLISYYNIEVKSFHEKRALETRIVGDNDYFNRDQLTLLRSLDYGSSFFIGGNIKKKSEISGKIESDTLVHYMTVVPDQPAVYISGFDSLEFYLKENSKEIIQIARRDRIQPGKISFKVSAVGNIEQATLTYSSGYPSIDEKMLQLIQEIPGKWEVAKDASGKKVDQELVLFFGLTGC